MYISKKTVLVEKPLALNPKEARDLVDLAKRNGVLLKTIFHRRYNQCISDLINNELGNIRFIYARYLENIPDHSNNENWYCNIEQSGGGCIMDNGINVIDVIRQLVGELTVTDVHIGYSKNGKRKFDKNAFIELTYTNGKAFIQLDWLFPGEIKDLTIFTNKDEVVYRDFLQNSREFKSSLWEEYEVALSLVVKELKQNSYSADIDSVRALEIIKDIYKFKQNSKLCKKDTKMNHVI